MKKLLTILIAFVATVTASAQYSNNTAYDFYNDDFDWRWDIRVRITDGINNGLITRWESNRLYKRLERVEQQEYAYVNDGVYEPWEQDEIWEEIQWLHRQVGIQLRDGDRTFYGYNRPGVVFYGYPSWYYNGGYSFRRYDNWGYGSVRYGYAARCYTPRYYGNNRVYAERYPYRQRNVYYNNGNNRNSGYNSNRESTRNRTYGSRSSSGRGNSTDYNNRNDDSYSRGTTPSVGRMDDNETRSAATPRVYSPSTRSYDRTNSMSTNRNSTAPESVLPDRSDSRGSRANGAILTRPETPQRSSEPQINRSPSSESFNRTRSSSPQRSPQTQRSTPDRSHNEPRSAAPQRSAPEVRSNPTERANGSRTNSSRGTEGRTKVPETSRTNSPRGGN